MQVQAIEFEEVLAFDLSDDALEQGASIKLNAMPTPGPFRCL